MNKLLKLMILLAMGMGISLQGQNLILQKSETITSAMGIKSVVMNSARSKVYAMNLEDRSVFEFKRNNRKLLRKIIFLPTKGQGYNYAKKKWFPSYQEKPVEACLTHNDKYLWISLHNAGGVVIWDLTGGSTYVEGKPYKEAWYYEYSTNVPRKILKKKKVKLLWIKTGKTPKIITSTPNGQYLFVANWHSSSVSVINITSATPKNWSIIKTLKTGPIPRGLLVSPDSQFLYIGQMGSDYISIVNLNTFQKTQNIKVGINPRHMVMYKGDLFVSLNLSAKLLKVNPISRKIIKSVKTFRKPRTIALTEDGQYIFSVSYLDNYLQVFSTDDLHLIGNWRSAVHPVGIAVYQNESTIEAWVANYSSGTIKIFTFTEQ